MHVSEGQAPFELMKSKVGHFLVATPLMRSLYGLIKLLSFAGLGLAQAFIVRYDDAAAVSRTTLTIFQATSWLAMAICLLRGIPVIIEAIAGLRAQEASEAKRA